MSDHEPQVSLTRPNKAQLNLIWFVLAGAGIGIFLGNMMVGAVAGFAAWAVRRGLGVR